MWETKKSNLLVSTKYLTPEDDLEHGKGSSFKQHFVTVLHLFVLFFVVVLFTKRSTLKFTACSQECGEQ